MKLINDKGLELLAKSLDDRTKAVVAAAVKTEADRAKAEEASLLGKVNGKSDEGHSHDDRYFTEDEIINKLADKSDTDHKHDNDYAAKDSVYTKADVNTLLGTKASLAHEHNDLYYTEGEIDDLLEDKSNVGHDHDDDYAEKTHNHNNDYYTKTEVDGELGKKSDDGHKHNDDYYTKKQIDDELATQLATKSDTTHKHNDDYYTKSEVNAELSKKAESSHGAHVPTPQATDNKKFLRNDNTWADVTPENIGAAKESHDHDTKYYTISQIDAKVTTINNAIDGKANASHGKHLPETGTADNKIFLRNDGNWATVDPENIGAAKASHEHNQYCTTAIVNGHVSTLEGKITTAQANALADAKTYANQEIAKLVDSAPEAMNTLNELAEAIKTHNNTYTAYVQTVTSDIAAAKSAAIADAAAKDTALHTKISAEIDTDVKVEADRAKAAEQVLQANIDKKAATGHSHNNLVIKLNSGTTEGTNLFTYVGTADKTVNITASSIGASASGHNHDDKYYTESEIDAKITTINNAINGKANSSHGTHVTYDTTAPKANGTAAAGSSANVARADHVHPLQTTISGNAGSATKVNNNMVVKLNGGTTEGTNLFTFNGSAAKNINITPAAIGAEPAQKTVGAPTAAGTVITLTTNRYQKIAASGVTEIKLPSVSSFTEITLFVNGALTSLTLPDCKWRVDHNIEVATSYAITFTYTTVEWLAEIKCFS